MLGLFRVGLYILLKKTVRSSLLPVNVKNRKITKHVLLLLEP